MEQKLMNEYLNKHKIVITFNKDTLESYTEAYFKEHPKRKKPPLEWCGKTRNGQLVSWNRLINCPSRITQNQWKQDFALYTRHIVRELGLSNKGIEKCALVVRQANKTLSKSDTDNIMAKSSLDAMVKEGVFVEDNYTVINPVTLVTEYDKYNPRSEICIYEITEEYPEDFVLEVIQKELKK